MAIRIVLLLYCCGLIKAANNAMILPQGTVPVCAGDPLLLQCTVAGNLLEWRIHIMRENETRVDSYNRLIDTSFQTPESLTVNSIVFSFTTSAQHQISPLMSNLSISYVTRTLNRTEVMCVDRSGQDSSSAFIKVINTDEHVVQKSQVENFTIRIMQQDDNGINITIIDLGWKKSAYPDLFHYSVSIVPNQTHDLLTTKPTCIGARVLYETSYNVSIVAVPRCGHPQTSTALHIELFYSDCGERGFNNKNTTYQYQGMEATTIRNQCSGNIMRSTLYPTYGVDQKRARTALSQDGIIAVASSVLVFIISSVTFFIFGYLCGHYRKQQEQSLSSVTRAPVYEDVLPQHHTQDLELKSNVAYAQQSVMK